MQRSLFIYFSLILEVFHWAEGVTMVYTDLFFLHKKWCYHTRLFSKREEEAEENLHQRLDYDERKLISTKFCWKFKIIFTGRSAL